MNQQNCLVSRAKPGISREILQNPPVHSTKPIQVEVKVIPHCPFWVFPIVNAVSKKSSLSHPFDGFPHVNARFTEWFFITYDLDLFFLTVIAKDILA